MNNALGNHDCPPLMSDGRLYTDYRPSCYLHEMIAQQNHLTNSYDLKMFLTQNALQLQKINQDYYHQRANCQSCGGYRLVDPNQQEEYWKKYRQWIQSMQSSQSTQSCSK